MSICAARAVVWCRVPGGLDAALSGELAGFRKPRAEHDPGKVVLDLAVVLAAGGDCPADAAMLRGREEVFGPVASDPTISRTVHALAADPGGLEALRRAAGLARARAGGHLQAAAAPVRELEPAAGMVRMGRRRRWSSTSTAP